MLLFRCYLILEVLHVTYDINCNRMSTPTQCWLWYHRIGRVTPLPRKHLEESFEIFGLCLCIGVTLLPQYKTPLSCASWTPKSKAPQSLPSETKSRIHVIQLVLWIVDSGCLKHMTGNLQLLRNFLEKFIGTVRFGNDHFAAITRYGDYVQGNLMICHNLEGKDLHTGSRNSNLYTISISEMATSSLVCLISRATSIKSWLWHRRLSHMNFGAINQLTSKDLVNGLSKFKYNKDHLCSACEQGKSTKASLPPKLVPSTESKLELLPIDLCGPIRVANEAPDMIIDFINQVQRNLKAQILMIRIENGTEFKNEKLRAFYVKLGIVHKTSIARTPQQNGVVE
ncbi:retrovirus-related pol polyprotein from transposon TNT 1-94 [Tanacetum coccineum]